LKNAIKKAALAVTAAESMSHYESDLKEEWKHNLVSDAPHNAALAPAALQPAATKELPNEAKVELAACGVVNSKDEEDGLGAMKKMPTALPSWPGTAEGPGQGHGASHQEKTAPLSHQSVVPSSSKSQAPSAAPSQVAAERAAQWARAMVQAGSAPEVAAAEAARLVVSEFISSAAPGSVAADKSAIHGAGSLLGPGPTARAQIRTPQYRSLARRLLEDIVAAEEMYPSAEEGLRRQRRRSQSSSL
jgi:hypothetical protein